MRSGFFLAVSATLVGLVLTCFPAHAQEPARAMLLGTWEGKVTFGESARAVLEFSEQAGAIRWTYSFKYDPVLWGDAEGTVTSFSPPALQLAGTWTRHAVAGAAGTGVTFTLTVDGDRMTGTVTAAMNNTPVEISLTRKK
jgi:hypothetical protein